MENKVRAPARPGAIAPLSVVIPAHNTGLGPEKTSFFQALSIPTKISKGKNYLVSNCIQEVHLIIHVFYAILKNIFVDRMTIFLNKLDY